jgi:hypothetical protein
VGRTGNQRREANFYQCKCSDNFESFTNNSLDFFIGATIIMIAFKLDLVSAKWTFRRRLCSRYSPSSAFVSL